jgi:hypothetical protein
METLQGILVAVCELALILVVWLVLVGLLALSGVL